MSTPEPPTDTTAAVTTEDIAALMLPMMDRTRAQARVTPRYVALAEHDAVPALLAADCELRPAPIAELEHVLVAELDVTITPEVRTQLLLLGVAAVMTTLTRLVGRDQPRLRRPKRCRSSFTGLAAGARLPTEQ